MAGEGESRSRLRTAFLTTRDGKRLRVAHWPAAAGRRRGTVLLLNGRSEAVEKYQETAGDLVGRGFEVRGLDWRGQGLSDRVLPQRQRGHIDDFATLIADLDEVVDRVVAPALDGRPLVMLAHSMGAMIGLRYLAERPGPVRLAACTAPMLEILAYRQPRWVLTRLAALAVARGRGSEYAFGQGDYDPALYAFPGNPLTSDPRRFDAHKRVYQDHPELRLGGVTWGWVAAACRSAAILLRPECARRIRVPVLIASAGQERLVSNAAQRRLAALLPDGTLKIYPEARHEILMERDAVRNAFLADFDTFLHERGV